MMATEAHVVLTVDVRTATILRVSVLSSRGIYALGGWLANIPIATLSTTGEDYESARAECIAGLEQLAPFFGPEGHPIRDAIDSLVAGGDGGIQP